MRTLLHAVLLGFWLLPARVGAQQYDIRVFGVEDGLPGSTVVAISQDSSGYLWVETDRGPCRFDGRNFRETPGGAAPAMNAATSGPNPKVREEEAGLPTTCELVSPRTNNYWRGTTMGLEVYQRRQAEEPLFKLYWGNGLGSNEITSLFEDHSGVMWIGTRQGGLSRYVSDAVIRLGDEGGAYAKVMALHRTTGDDLRIAAGENGVAFEKTSGGSGSFAGYWPGGAIRALMGPGPGNLYAGNEGGVFILGGMGPNGAGVTIGPFIFNEAPVYAALTDERERCFVATGKGVITIGMDHDWMRMGLDTSDARAIAFKDDSLLIGTRHGLYSAPLDNSAANWTPIIRAGDEDITCLAVDRAHNIWIGTEASGLVRFQNGRTERRTTSDGLASNHIRQLLLDAYQNLWIGTDRGFNLLELDELQEEVIDISYYGTEEGFPGIEAMPNACMLDTDSSLWFGTTRGTIHFDPRKVLEDPVAPHTRIIDLELFHTHPDWGPWSDSLDAEGLPIGLELPYHQNDLSFNYSGLSLAYPEKVRFQYNRAPHNK